MYDFQKMEAFLENKSLFEIYVLAYKEGGKRVIGHLEGKNLHFEYLASPNQIILSSAQVSIYLIVDMIRILDIRFYLYEGKISYRLTITVNESNAC